MEELKNLFDKYIDKDIPLNILMNSADLYLDTLRKLLNKNDSKREKEIKEIIKYLEQFWLKHDCQRFGQLLENYVFTDGERGDVTSRKMFYQGDDTTLKNIKK